MLFTDEVKNMGELIEKVSTLTELDHIKVAVVGFIFDKDGKLVLHRRGPGARDEIGKLQAIGGSVNGSDADFREAMKRELSEEAGSNAQFEIESFIGAQVDGKIDNTNGKFINWIILAYKINLVDGVMVNNEPDRCIGFEKDTMENFLTQEVSTTASNFIKYLIENK